MLQRFGTESVTAKGDGRMKGSGEKVEEGYTASGQNHIRIAIHCIQRSARKQQNTVEKLVSGRRDGSVEHRPHVIHPVEFGC